MFKNKINLLTTLISVMLISTLVLTGCGNSAGSANSDMETLKYGGQLYPEEYLLKGQDFWSKYGLTVEHTLFSSGGENNQALISGAIDVNIGSDSKSVALFNAMGDQVVIIALPARRPLFHHDTGRLRHHSWYDMKGQNVGIRLGTGAEQVVRRYFEIVGDLSWKISTGSTSKLRIGRGLADGSIVSFTAGNRPPPLRKPPDGAQVMMSYGDYAHPPVLIHTTKLTQKAPDELVAFLEGQLDKVDMILN